MLYMCANERTGGERTKGKTKGRANERSNAIMHCSAKFGERESSRLARSAEKMTQERESERSGVTFSISPDRAEPICSMMIDRNVNGSVSALSLPPIVCQVPMIEQVLGLKVAKEW